MKHLTLISLFIALFGTVWGAEIVKGPYTEDVEQKSAIVKFVSTEVTPAWLEYGPLGKCNQLMAISAPSRSHRFVLHGLTPNTQFCYKAYVKNNSGDGVQEGSEGTFKTLFTPERKIVNFLVIGNTSAQSDVDTSEIKNTMARNMTIYESDFLVHTGNISSSGLAADETAQFFDPYQRLLKNMPLVVAIGSDEYGPDAKTDAGKGFLAAHYKSNHTMPWSAGTPNYYYFDTANARIVVIDTNNLYGALQAPGIDKKSAQYEWLKSTLAKAGADKWKIVIMHHPVYSSGATEDLLSAFLAPLFEVHQVKLVIQGHQGAYERTKPIRKGVPSKNGPIYITVGGGGKFFEESSYANEWRSKYFAVPHFSHIKIVDRKLSLRTYTHDNKLIDALDINF
ncbi:MAG: metallophosphoesterase [Elusimicrobiaceae bacterium]|nr:metallophosphoesterase [Elusimicrobiaceae bacterium]